MSRFLRYANRFLYSHIALYNFLNQVSRFTQCDVCAAIKEARMRTLDPGVRKWLQKILDKHAELVM